MAVRLRHLLGTLAIIAVCLGAARSYLPLRSVFRDVAITIDGTFSLEGQYPGKPLTNGSSLRKWGSWCNSDDHTGSLRIGPFAAPAQLQFAVGGYPGNTGNELFLERTDSHERIKITGADAIGERWQVVKPKLPADWVGRPVTIVAIDGAKGVGGWLAVSEPLKGGLAEGNGALIESLACFVVNGVFLGLVCLGSVRYISRRSWVHPSWVPLVAAGAVATIGYLLFWLYFAAPTIGTIGAIAVLLMAAIVLIAARGKVCDEETGREFRPVMAAMVAIGFFYITLLHLFPTSLGFYDVAANRFLPGLPADNILPYLATRSLVAGATLRPEGAEWLTSDRPPLQTGWQLITMPVTTALQLDEPTATGTASVWLQLLWIPAAYGLFRLLGLTRRIAVGWIVLLSISGFFLQHTVFTWPKLSAAAFGCGAFAIWTFPRDRTRGASAYAAGAALAGLAWLSHGGIAFSFIALAPWIAWRMMRGEVRGWLLAALVFLAFAIPWFAFQKFYNPPGDRLLKMHLAGVPNKDPRGVWTVASESYRAKTRAEIIDYKLANFGMLSRGNWREMLDFKPSSNARRQRDEFFFLFRSLTWWLPAAVILPLGLLCRSVRQQIGPVARIHLSLLAWAAGTTVVWCLLMFGPYTTSIHQGSLALELVLFVLLSSWLESVTPWLRYALGAIQLTGFVTTWAWATPTVGSPATGWPFVAAAAMGLLLLLGWSFGAADANEGAVKRPARTGTNCRMKDGPIRKRISVAREWLTTPAATHVAVLLALVLLILHKPWALHTPQLWAEDGSVFLNNSEQYGIGAFWRSYQGYLHLIPRLIVATARIADVAYWPAIYNAGALAITAGVLARMASPRLELPHKPWLILAFALAIQTGEVLFNITNVQWISAFFLIQQLFINPPTTSRQRLGDLAVTLLAGLTGPFAIVLLPFFAWRAYRETNKNWPIVIVVALCAATQTWFLIREPGVMPPPPSGFDWRMYAAVVGNRLVVWPLVGTHLAGRLFPPALIAISLVTVAAIVVSTLLRRDWRTLNLLLLAAALIVAISLRARPDGWHADDFINGDRYFFIPRVLLIWALIAQFDASIRWWRTSARALCVIGALAELPNHAIAAPRNYHWADHCDPIRYGRPTRIPTLPEGWTLEYPGRPASR